MRDIGWANTKPGGTMGAFVSNKDMTDLLASFSVSMTRYQTVCVYIWKSKAGLYRNTRWKSKTYVGAYIAWPHRRRHRGLFAEIHLVKDHITIRNTSHEVQHLTQDWICNGFPPGHVFTSEKICYFHGDFMHNLFERLVEIDFRPSRVPGRHYLRVSP